MNASFSCRTVLVASSNASPNFTAQGLSVDRGAMCGPIWSVNHAKSTPTIKPPFLDARPSGPGGTASAAGGSQKNVLCCSTWNNRLSSQATCSRTEVSSRCGGGGRLAPGGVWGTSRPAHKLFSIHHIIIFRLCKENAACVADARTPIPGQHCGGVWKIGGRAAEQGLVNIFWDGFTVVGNEWADKLANLVMRDNRSSARSGSANSTRRRSNFWRAPRRDRQASIGSKQVFSGQANQKTFRSSPRRA